eukprot:PhM_4_TR6739/c1_g2_i3/m.13888
MSALTPEAPKTKRTFSSHLRPGSAQPTTSTTTTTTTHPPQQQRCPYTLCVRPSAGAQYVRTTRPLFASSSGSDSQGASPLPHSPSPPQQQQQNHHQRATPVLCRRAVWYRMGSEEEEDAVAATPPPPPRTTPSPTREFLRAATTSTPTRWRVPQPPPSSPPKQNQGIDVQNSATPVLSRVREQLNKTLLQERQIERNEVSFAENEARAALSEEQVLCIHELISRLKIEEKYWRSSMTTGFTRNSNDNKGIAKANIDTTSTRVHTYQQLQRSLNALVTKSSLWQYEHKSGVGRLFDEESRKLREKELMPQLHDDNDYHVNAARPVPTKPPYKSLSSFQAKSIYDQQPTPAPTYATTIIIREISRSTSDLHKQIQAQKMRPTPQATKKRTEQVQPAEPTEVEGAPPTPLEEPEHQATAIKALQPQAQQTSTTEPTTEPAASAGTLTTAEEEQEDVSTADAQPQTTSEDAAPIATEEAAVPAAEQPQSVAEEAAPTLTEDEPT